MAYLTFRADLARARTRYGRETKGWIRAIRKSGLDQRKAFGPTWNWVRATVWFLGRCLFYALRWITGI